MDDVLIETEDFKNGNETLPQRSNSNAFDAEMEIAEAFGSIPCQPKESPPAPVKMKDQQESSTSTLQEASEQNTTISESPGNNNSGAFEDAYKGTGYGTMKNNRSKRYSQKPPLYQDYQNNKANQNMPIASSSLISVTSCFGSGVAGSPSPTFFVTPQMMTQPPPNIYPPNGLGFSNYGNKQRSFSYPHRVPSTSGFANVSEVPMSGCMSEKSRLNARQNISRRRLGNKLNNPKVINLNSDHNDNKICNNQEAKDLEHSEAPQAAANNFSFNPFAASPSLGENLYQQQHVEEQLEPVVFGSRRALHGLKEEIPSKRRCRVTCYICGKTGHSSDDCFRNPKNTQNRESIRCYNCNERGHMAVRCMNRTIPSNKQMRKERKNSIEADNNRKEAGTVQNKLGVTSQSDLKGLEVICKLMKDKHLREEAAKKTPILFDEMLTYMIEHINLNVTSK